jgi:hypothetical protein
MTYLWLLGRSPSQLHLAAVDLLQHELTLRNSLDPFNRFHEFKDFLKPI